MDSSGEQHLQMDHNIHKRRLDLDGNPIEEPKKEEIAVSSTVCFANIRLPFSNSGAKLIIIIIVL